jgi:hypothetical protein
MDPDEIDNFEDYIEAALKTAPDGSPVDRLHQGALGTIAEYREYNSAIDPDEKRRERGDMLWYLALLCEGANAIGDLLLHTDEQGAISASLYQLCGAVEDYAHQGKDGAADDVCEHVASLYSRLMRRIDDPTRVMRENIAKLSDRYPDGYEPGGGQRGGNDA